MEARLEGFYGSEIEALRDDVDACGGTKDVGEWFWPDKSVENRRNRVNDRLNPARDERFTDDQKLLIMRRARERRGFSATLYFLCDEIGFERPRAKTVKDEALELQVRAEQVIRELRILTERQERLARSPLAIVGAKTASGA